MTKVNVTFGRPGPYFGIELDAQSQAAYDKWQAVSDQLHQDAEWDEFVEEFQRQMRPLIGTAGWIDEVYPDEE